MNRQNMCIVVVCLSLVINSVIFADDNLQVLPETVNGVKPVDMMKHYLTSQAQKEFDRWKADYEQRKSPEQITEYQKSLRSKFLEAIGPFPRRTPLKARITGEMHRDGYKVEKIIFESQPKHYVSALLFLPNSRKHKAPYPGVLVPCGHSRNGKASEAYQTMGALLALNGMAAMVFDPIDQGERNQLLSQLPQLQGTRAHTMVGVGSILLGRNTAWFEIWDSMRGIDYLQSRPEIDSRRIGCTGNSGGGTQTSHLMSLDSRIVAAAPSCYITSFERLLSTIGPQDAEQNIYGQIAFGMDHADYIMMRAPKPTLICAATNDFFDIQGVWNSFRYAKRLYTRMGFAERIDLMENDATHNYNKLQRQSVVRWMARWLLNKDEPITEPEIKLLSEEEIKCSPTGQVMNLAGARSTYDLNRDYEKKLSKQRQRLWTRSSHDKLLNQIRTITGIRRLKELPEPKVEVLGVIERDGYFIKKVVLKSEEGIYLPALMFSPKQGRSKGMVLYINAKGKNVDARPGGPIEKLVKSGRTVLSVDLRGTGETGKTSGGTLSKATGFDWKNGFTAYLLGRSYVGMRGEDILTCGRFLKEQKNGPVDLVTVGHVSVPALHAAALEPDMFGSVKLIRGLICWSDVIESGISVNQFVNTVHGALKLYDLPNLAETLGDKLKIEEPLNALGEPINIQ
ncbi:MAG: alpha/beta hydrolase family protein [Planctomycetota bacterium]|jgi:cephalosporin-C deacetylase-like acetyl esterase